MPERSTLTLPKIPAIYTWPVAVRSAEILRGTLVHCGPGSRPVGWPETSRIRATALAPWYTEHRVAVRMSAAWIWGATRHPGKPLRFATLGGRRAEMVSTSIMTLQQLRLADSDVVYCDSFAVTSPLRTALDLLRDPEGFDARSRAAYRLLLPLIAGGADAVTARLVEGPQAYRNVALTRIRGGERDGC
ncbi:hypothetical protein G7068_01845 [Leucobacter viscericola]|uniref:AbiEi antitoxin C-terminal domain-containing protein n=1 Tax=Leucobacter viscericola TaxID=2714935 RepID=A0A6G7XCI3_9MICO|nr:hypothetical protein [Leucobacter viscericola]QIK62081.1 hypothetical protein G7068_01845 [Leucobacter viscericola]